MEKDDLILITGAGGFIGGHLIADLLRQGYKKIRAVDIKPFNEWYQIFGGAENIEGDLRKLETCQTCCRDVRYVYNLAADMGGMGFIELNKAECMLSVFNQYTHVNGCKRT